MDDDQKAIEGIVYLITNPVMPGLVMIGRTQNLSEEIKRLYSENEGVPVPFEYVFAKQVEDYVQVEKSLHAAFGDQRINVNKKWFRIDPSKIEVLFKVIPGKEINLDENHGIENENDKDALKKATSRATNFNFEMIDIGPGAILESTFDSNITATVYDNKKIMLNGNIVSLSEGAKQIAFRTNKSTHTAYRGPYHWTYKGKTLTELRDEMEQGEN